jgi:DNA adenine methylase
MARSSTSYPRKWRNSKTVVIRVPESLAPQLLKMARKMDQSPSFKVKEEPGTLVLELSPSKRVSYNVDAPVNVASVPQRSPFRYPGGKTWLVPYIRSWLQSLPVRPSRLIEPFAGGAIVSLTAGFEGLARHVIFCEKDPAVAAVWRVVLNGHANWLAEKIESFDLTLPAVKSVLEEKTKSLPQRAFQTILRNRVQRGGIMAPGAGLVKTGENGRGINSRWYPQTLARRIQEINLIKDRFTFIEGDAFELITEHARDRDAAFYIDPPYTSAAKRLYSTWQVDHAQLFRMLARVQGDFLMSYDKTDEIEELARQYNFQTRAIAMKNTHHAKMSELLIGKNLAWLNRK